MPFRGTDTYSRQYLQSFLADNEHDEVNKIRWYPMEQYNDNCVHEFVTSDITAGIPKRHFERVFVGNGFAFFDDFAPFHGVHVTLRQIVDRYFGWSVNLNSCPFLFGNQDKRVEVK